MKNFERLEEVWEDEQLILYDLEQEEQEEEQEEQEEKEVSDYEYTHS